MDQVILITVTQAYTLLWPHSSKRKFLIPAKRTFPNYKGILSQIGSFVSQKRGEATLMENVLFHE